MGDNEDSVFEQFIEFFCWCDTWKGRTKTPNKRKY